MSTDTPVDADPAPDVAGGPARPPLRRSWIPWIPLFIVLGLALAAGTFGATHQVSNADRVVAITKTIKCPECVGESVAESNSDFSKEIRAEVAKKVDAGESDDEILDYYAEKYRDAILLTPRSSGITGLVWIIPVVALVCSLAGLAFAFRRWGDRSPVAVTDEDRTLVADALAREHERASTTTGEVDGEP